MSEQWRCDKGHSGTLDKPEYGGPPTLPSGCPVCGSRIAPVPGGNDDGDQTFAPQDAAPSQPDATLDGDAPRDPLDVLGSTVNLDRFRASSSLPSLDVTIQGDDDAPPASAQDLGGTLNLESAVAPSNSATDVTFQDDGGAPSSPSAHDATMNLESAAAEGSQLDYTLKVAGAAARGDQTADFDAEAKEPHFEQTVDLVAPVRQPRPHASPGTGGHLLGQTVDLHAAPPKGTQRPAGDQTAALGGTVALDPNQASAGEATLASHLAKAAVRTARKADKERVLPAVAGYDLISELGRGGMGVVYKARQQGLNRLVALKMVLAANRATARDLARFSIEAEAVAQLVHPNIVQIYEVGEREGCPFFSLEFVPGGTLSDCTETKAQPPKRAARIVRALATAMDFAHRRGIIHRDLKPANVLLSLPENVPSPKQGEPFPLDVCIPKITDFGLAKRLEGDSGHTRDGAIMGTPNYMAPEQAKGKNKDIGPAADIYALGSILYDLLTGTPPFKGSTIMETLHLVVNREPESPRKLNALVPNDLSTICLKCLEKDPARRYATAGDLAEDLRRYLEGEPIQARPSSWVERSVKWARRRPAAASLVGVCVLTVLAMSFGGVAFAFHEQATATRATDLKNKAEAQEIIANQKKDEADLARKDAETKRAEAETSRRAAETNFREACKAVDDMLLAVGSKRLAQEPRMEKVRRELLDKAYQFYAKHLQETSEDPNVRWRTARSSQQLGDIENILGHTQQAEGHYLRAVKLLGALTDQFSTDKSYRQDLANAHHSLGVLYNDGRKLDKAENEHKEAHKLRKALTDEDSENVAYRSDLALSAYNFGQVEYRRGRLPEAKEALTNALEQTQQLPNAKASATRQQIARIDNSLGQTLQDMGKPDEGRKAFEHARDTLTDLARSDREKEVPEYREELSLTHNNLGQLLRDTNPLEAEKAYTEALKLAQGLADDFPATPAYRQHLAVSLNNLALLLQAKGDDKKAEELYVRAIDVRRQLAKEMPWKPDLRLDLVVALKNRSVQLSTDGRLEDADNMIVDALDTIRSLLIQYAQTDRYQQELGRCLYNLALLRQSRGKPDDANTFMAEALKVLKELADRSPDVAEYQYEYGRAQMNRGSLLVFQRQFDKAPADYLAAVETLKPVVKQNPDVPDYKYQLAMAYCTFADVQSLYLNNGTKAALVWPEAQKLLSELAERYRGVPVYRSALAKSYTEYGRRLAIDGKMKDAEAAWEKEQKLLQDLVDQFRNVPAYRIELAKTLMNLGLVASKIHSFDTVEAHYRAAVKVLDDYDGAGIQSALYRVTHASALTYLARAIAINKSVQEAQTKYERAIKLWEGIAQELDNDPTYRCNLARAQHELAGLHIQSGESRTARDLSEKAVENQRAVVARVPNNALYHQYLMAHCERLLEVYQNLDDYANLARAAAEYLKMCDATAEPRVDAAKHLAMCIIAVERDKNLSGLERVVLRMLYAEQAMRYLQEAAKRGFKDAATLEKADAFAPLRERADFQELLRQMGAI